MRVRGIAQCPDRPSSVGLSPVPARPPRAQPLLSLPVVYRCRCSVYHYPLHMCVLSYIPFVFINLHKFNLHFRIS